QLEGLRALRRLALRSPTLSLRHPILHRPLATVSKTFPPTKKGVRVGVERNPCLDFYRTKIDLAPFSCDWDKFSDWHFFTVPPEWHDLTEMDFFARRVYKLPGTVRPLAYLMDTPEACIAFEAGGEYYYLDTASRNFLVCYGGDFTSHDSFLTAFIHDRPCHLEGTVHKFPDNVGDLDEVVFREQRLRKKVAKKRGVEL
ncbi:hypothetical protein GGX14DRAFT_429031, partial [Mycena pura]